MLRKFRPAQVLTAILADSMNTQSGTQWDGFRHVNLRLSLSPSIHSRVAGQRVQ